jgi:hypothetical protein
LDCGLISGRNRISYRVLIIAHRESLPFTRNPRGPISVSSAIRLSLISFWAEAIIRMRIVNWIISHIVEVVVWLIVTFIGTSIIKKLPMKLGENALIGWIDDRLGEFLGISAPTLQQVSCKWPPTADKMSSGRR